MSDKHTLELTQREKDALYNLVNKEVQAIIDPYRPYPDVVIEFWLPLLKKVKGSMDGGK